MPPTALPQRTPSPSPTPRQTSSATRTASAERPLTRTAEEWSAITLPQLSTPHLLWLNTANPRGTTRAMFPRCWPVNFYPRRTQPASVVCWPSPTTSESQPAAVRGGGSVEQKQMQQASACEENHMATYVRRHELHHAQRAQETSRAGNLAMTTCSCYLIILCMLSSCTTSRAER